MIAEHQNTLGESSEASKLSVTLDSAGILNFASIVNKVPIVQRIELQNHTDTDLRDLAIHIRSNPELIEPKTLHVSQIYGGQKYVVGHVDLSADKERLSQLNEPMVVTLTANAVHKDEVLASTKIDVEAAAYEQWPGERLIPQLLAAFSQPNTKATAGIQKHAAQILRAAQSETTLSGYQTGDRKDVLLQISAIYSAIARLGLDYANPPAALAQEGQRIRTPARIIQDRLATCLDTTLLMASVLEACNLHPVLLLTKGHAWVACWLTNSSLASVCIGDAQEIRKRISAGEMIAVETTLVCAGNQARFNVAMARGAERLDPEKYDDFCFAIDVTRARNQKISPLPAPGEKLTDEEPETQAAAEQVDLEAPQLPELAEETAPEAVADSKETSERIEQWKTQLLDHSMRNRLLNCEPGKHSLRFTHPEPAKIEDLLADGKKLRIESIMKHAIDNDPRSEALLSRHADKSYQAQLAEQALERDRLVALSDEGDTNSRAIKLFRAAKSNEEETGSNTLYFCIGSLTWRPADKSKDYQAPLLMLPIRLERRSIGSAFRVVRHDDEPILNPTLLQVLLEQFAISIPEIPAPHALPTDDSGVDVNRILSLFQRAVAEQPNMEVRTDIIQLGNYSFAKYLLWKDLASKANQLLAHPLVNLMVEGSKEAAEELHQGEFLDTKELDEKVDVGDLNLVTMADASQMVVIHEASQGRSFVVEGPPGTGKSETITNLIADQLGRGKRVLFVSEKMEALEVVHKRLCKVGLEPFLMVLHAAKASKREVLNQYRKAIDAAHAIRPEGWEALRDQLRQKRNALNAYVQMMHEPHPSGLSVHQAITLLARHSDWKPAALSWPDLESIGKEQAEQLASSARNMGVLAENFGGFGDNPLTAIHATTFTPAWRDELIDAAAAYRSAFDKLHQLTSKFCSTFKINHLQWTATDYDKTDRLIRLLLNAPPVIQDLVNGESADHSLKVIDKVSTALKERQDLGELLFEDWVEDSLKLDVSDYKLRWRAAMGKFWPLSWFEKFGIRGQLAPYTRLNKRPKTDEVLDALDQIKRVQEADQALVEIKGQAEALLGSEFQGLETNVSLLGQNRAWMEKMALAVGQIFPAADQSWNYQKFLIRSVGQHRARMNSTGDLGQLFEAALSAKATHDKVFQIVCEKAARKPSEITCGEPNELHNWAAEIGHWEGATHKLQPWCVWRKQRSEAIERGLKPLVDALEEGNLTPGEFEEFFHFSFANWWLNEMVGRSPILQNFSRALHEREIDDFRELDAMFIEATRQEIFAQLAANVPRPDVNIPGSPMGFLRDQITRQRGHRPIREIMEKLAAQNQQLKPCMMMSPLTVAQYLDVADTKFDIVIFDEASQIKTCDAIGVIARAPQVIVVGDSKQLPPTSFFAKGSPDDDGAVQDHESILDECAAVLPSRRLTWHYRSRNENLIAFSNDRYYEGELITMPAPTSDTAVVLHKVPGVYDRGRSRTNRIEADAVINFIRKRVLASGTRKQSVGVVTFSATQQGLIQDLLDRACGEDPQLEQAVAGAYNQDGDEIFVKNLESVQGDQRDVIVFSICYGPTHNGNVYNEFGPLTREGGQRRLNVAVTRAAEEVHVFSSMVAEDIKNAYLQATESGVGDLKRYLSFARDGVGALETYSSPTGRDVDSEFEAQVLRRLSERGWNIHLQVGISKFRIDLGVVDPRKPGRYLAGVECDGATYHSCATARDRDIVRQGVLENLGWKILRIWSTDWWNDPDAEVERIHGELLMLKEIPLDDPQDEDADFDPDTCAVEETETESESDMDDEAVDEPILLRADAAGSPIHERYPTYQAPNAGVVSIDIYDIRASASAVKAAEQALKTSAPMLKEPLYRSVLEAFEQRRLTSKAEKALDRYLMRIPSTVEHGEKVFWESEEQTQGYVEFRVRGNRTLSEVPLIELVNLANELLMHAIQCPKVDLAKAMSEQLGLQRMTADARARLVSSIDKLIDSGCAAAIENDGVRHVSRNLG